MYTIRVNNRLPQQAYRICRAAPVACNREMSLFPRLIANDFAPMFRLMDDYANHVSTRNGFNSTFSQSLRSFNPRFDVRETNEAYELQGEVPGINHEDLNIEFTDAQTLSIRGRTETRREEGTRPTPAAIEDKPQQAASAEIQGAAATSDTASSETSSYHKPTVEDEAGTAESSTSAAAESAASETPAESTAAQTQTTTTEAPRQQDTGDSSHYWVSERSVGTFQRSFAFPTRVDQDSVKASLSNGILSIVVPKATAPETRRISIQ